MRRTISYALVLVMVLTWLFFPTAGFCAGKEKLANRIEDSTAIIEEMMRMPEIGIPTTVFSKCSGIAIFPKMLKGGFIWGAKYGQGILLHHDRQTNNWSPPAFFTIGGASWGLQIGGQAIDLILVLNGEDAIDGLLRGKLTLGGGVAVTAGPVGRDAEIAGDIMLKTGVFSYSRAKGAFAGMTLEGAVITPNNSSNQNFYGQGITAREILLTGGAKASAEGSALINTLKKYSK